MGMYEDVVVNAEAFEATEASLDPLDVALDDTIRTLFLYCLRLFFDFCSNGSMSVGSTRFRFLPDSEVGAVLLMELMTILLELEGFAPLARDPMKASSRSRLSFLPRLLRFLLDDESRVMSPVAFPAASLQTRVEWI